MPIECTAILAGEFPDRLLNETELRRARDFLLEPDIGVLRDARIALEAGRVTSLHDPTEGGIATALWELAEASGCSLRVQRQAIPVPELSARICGHLGIDPLATIASGAPLLTDPAEDGIRIRQALERAAIPCNDIGEIEPEPAAVLDPSGDPWPYPERDGIAHVYADAEEE